MAVVKHFLLIFAVVFGQTVLAAVIPVPQTASPKKIRGAKTRNVVFILSDDHRYDAMSFMGQGHYNPPGPGTRSIKTASG